MKKIRSIMIVAMAAMMLAVFAGCSRTVDWDNVKRDDEVAECGSIQLDGRMVQFQYAIENATSDYTSQFYSQLGGTGQYDATVYMDDCFKETLNYLVLAKIAADKGMTVSDDDAKASAYDEYFLAAKKYDYIGDFSEKIKEQMYLGDDKLLEYATEYNKLTDSAEEVIKAEFEKLNAADYKDLDAMTEAVTANVKELIKDETITILLPSKYTEKASSLDITQTVANVKWNYSSLFNDTTASTSASANASASASGAASASAASAAASASATAAPAASAAASASATVAPAASAAASVSATASAAPATSAQA